MAATKQMQGDWQFRHPLEADHPFNGKLGTEEVEVPEGESAEIAVRGKAMKSLSAHRILTVYFEVSNLREVTHE